MGEAMGNPTLYGFDGGGLYPPYKVCTPISPALGFRGSVAGFSPCRLAAFPFLPVGDFLGDPPQEIVAAAFAEKLEFLVQAF